jgi:hypothetical protein
MEDQGADRGMSAAFITLFLALCAMVRSLFNKIKNKTATEDEKIAFHEKLAELITKMRWVRTTYLDPADLSDILWAAWGLAPRKHHHTAAAQIFTALKVSHEYARGDVGTVIFYFVPVGGKGWGKEVYCDAFDIYFDEYIEGAAVPGTEAAIMALRGHEVVRTGRPRMNWEQWRGKMLMVFVRMINANPLPGPFNDPPDFVRIT